MALMHIYMPLLCAFRGNSHSFYVAFCLTDSHHYGNIFLIQFVDLEMNEVYQMPFGLILEGFFSLFRL